MNYNLYYLFMYMYIYCSLEFYLWDSEDCEKEIISENDNY